MKAAETRVISTTAHPGGHTDVQTEEVCGLGAMPDVTARLTLIHMGPRGGWKSVTALLTDAQRREVIEMLGGTVPAEPAPTNWAVRFPDGAIEQAGILGENRARMLAHRCGAELMTRRGPDAEWLPAEEG